MSRREDRLRTALGCRVTVVDASTRFARRGGVFLHLLMDQPGDGRQAEVYLDATDVARLRRLLRPYRRRWWMLPRDAR